MVQYQRYGENQWNCFFSSTYCGVKSSHDRLPIDFLPRVNSGSVMGLAAFPSVKDLDSRRGLLKHQESTG